MASRICDLPEELVGEILSKVPATSLRAIRSTCKNWNLLSRNQAFGKGKSTGKQFMSFMIKDFRVCSMKFDLDSMEPSIKQVAILDQFEISKVYYCDGLVLCLIKENYGLVVWNPYLGQTRRIQPRNSSCFDTSDRFVLGYDNNRNHKILRICSCGHEIYDFSSHSWRFSNYPTPVWHIPSGQRIVSLKGDAYLLVKEVTSVSEQGKTKAEEFLLCFDFTTERFGPRLPLPPKFHSYLSLCLTLSCVRDEQLAVLTYHLGIRGFVEVWVTDKIYPSALSWSEFLRSSCGSHIDRNAGSFFIDEEKKVVVVFDLDEECLQTEPCRYQTVHIYGQERFFKSVNIGKAPNLETATYGSSLFRYIPRKYCLPLICASSYDPSLVQLPVNQSRKRKQRYV